MTLESFCDSGFLSSDRCKTMKELEYTFIDAYKYYVGRKPRQNIVDKFLRTKEAFATNGIGYYFTY